MSLKGQAPQDEEMRRYGDHLKNEMTRDFGRPVPRALLPYPLTVSTTYFDQMHLPDGMLTNAKVPVLISDHCPGVVMPVPCRFWPDDFRREWMDASEQRFGRRHEARQLREQFRTARTRAAAAAVPREQQAARLHEDGMRHLRGEGVEPDAKKAARLLEQAARLGHLASMHEYAVLCEQGRGVGQDAGSALAWYGQAAERDFTPAQLGLGRLHLQADGIAPDRDKARHWLGMAAAAGSDEARQLLRDAGLDGNAVQRALRKFFS
jgi:hypothetical protein